MDNQAIESFLILKFGSVQQAFYDIGRYPQTYLSLPTEIYQFLNEWHAQNLRKYAAMLTRIVK